MRRRSIAFALGTVVVFSGGLAFGQAIQTASPTAQIDETKTQSTGAIPARPGAIPTTPAQPAEPAAAPPAVVPLTPAEQKAADNKAALDALLAEATALRTSYENSRRGRNKTPVSLSAFRSMELRLQMAAAADPANTQASDMANAMRMAQYEILQPSVQIAAIANRELYAPEMAKQMHDDGMRVMA